MIRFTDPKGKDRNAFLKPINDINQIIKHTFVSSIIDDTGVLYQGVSNIELGYHMALTNLHKHLNIPEGYLLKIHNTELYKIIKDEKKNIVGYMIHEDVVAFILSDGKPKVFGQLKSKFDEYGLYLDKYKPLLENINETIELSDDEIENLVCKQVVVKEHDNKRMILTHKLLPVLKKCDKCTIDIIDLDDNFFIGKFNIYVNDVTTIHCYRFLKF
ncbi:hypothetical protein [Romboutsia ilealis]|uniref:hypothetical protein n=1 Tax=Romboutsia ilealis TaxID=1115758 RepID=UPI00272C0F63|nr:hypothetical protein [Romboutsia ilealis]